MVLLWGTGPGKMIPGGEVDPEFPASWTSLPKNPPKPPLQTPKKDGHELGFLKSVKNVFFNGKFLVFVKRGLQTSG